MKLKIIIRGKVHDVGYRPFLLGLAESLEIERFFADNVFINDKQAVEVLIDDADEKVETFVELVKKKKPENAEVESIDFEEYDGSVMKTESYYRYLTAMQLAKIATYGGEMLKKQDETIKVIREESEKTRVELGKVIKEESEKTREELGEKIDLAKDELGNKMDLLRSDLREYMESNLKRIYEEITEIKEALRRAGIL